MSRDKFNKLTPKQQLEIADNFKSNHTRRDTYGAEDAIEDYRRDDNGLEDMADDAGNDNFTGIRNLSKGVNKGLKRRSVRNIRLNYPAKKR